MSDRFAVAGGGGVAEGEGIYSPTYDVWLLDEAGRPTPLPPLPDLAGGIVQGLSGTQVDDTLVLAASECDAGFPGEFLQCGPRTSVVYTMPMSGGEWSARAIPDEMVGDLQWPDGVATGGVDLRVFGHHRGRAYLALTNNRMTRFMAYDVRTDAFQVLADGPPTSNGWAATPFCLDEGTIVLVRHHRDHGNPLGDLQGLAEDVSVSRLGRDGRWVEGPRLTLGDVESMRPVGAVDVDCSVPGEPLASVAASPTVIAEVVDVERRPTLTVLDGISSSLRRGQSRAAGSAAGALDEIVGRSPGGELIVHTKGAGPGQGALVAPSGDGAPTPLDRFGSVGLDQAAFMYGDVIGTVNTRTGALQAASDDLART